MLWTRRDRIRNLIVFPNTSGSGGERRRGAAAGGTQRSTVADLLDQNVYLLQWVCATNKIAWRCLCTAPGAINTHTPLFLLPAPAAQAIHLSLFVFIPIWKMDIQRVLFPDLTSPWVYISPLAEIHSSGEHQCACPGREVTGLIATDGCCHVA